MMAGRHRKKLELEMYGELSTGIKRYSYIKNMQIVKIAANTKFMIDSIVTSTPSELSDEKTKHGVTIIE